MAPVRPRPLLVLLTLFCVGLFLYKSGECLSLYLKFETVSKQTTEPQQAFPLPSICLSSKNWKKAKLKSVGITSNQYKFKGVWTSNSTNMTAEEVYEFVSHKLEDIVHTIEVEISQPNTDYSREVLIDVTKGAAAMAEQGLTVRRLDSDTGLIYCLDFSYEHGLQEITIISQYGSLRIDVTPPGSYFGYERQRNQFPITPGCSWSYLVTRGP
jgi:hypothetical protein